MLRGTRSVNIPKSVFSTPDYTDQDQGFLRADLYAIYSDQPIYYILYDPNEEALDQEPWVGEYIGAEDGTVWEIVVTQAELDAIFNENNGYPLQRKLLKAKGYKFIGWKLDYIRETTGLPSGGQYLLTLPDNSFRIYKTWFNDVVENEFVLHAIWKRQYAVKFNPNADGVTNMPDGTYSPLKPEGDFTGNPKRAVFNATVPKRDGYYFAGWSSDPDYDISQNGLSGLLRRNGVGPSVNLNSFTSPEYSDTDPYNYQGFMCADLYAVWSPTPVYQVTYSPNESALANGEFLGSSMPSENLVGGEWVFDYTQTQLTDILNSADGENNKADYYPLLKGDLSAKGYVYTGWTLNYKKSNGSDAQKTYNVSNYGNDTFRIYKSIFNETGDYQFNLTANWEPRYTVLFHENAGGGDVTNMPVTNPTAALKASDFNGTGSTKFISDKGSVTSMPPQRENYIFLGWSTTENATASAPLLTRSSSGVKVALTDFVTPVNGSFQADLYAVWGTGYDVSYEIEGDTPAGASALPDTVKHQTGEENIAVADDMTAAGYTFSGWTVKTAPDGFTLSGNTFTMPAGDVVFKGSFLKNSHNVIYMNGSAQHASQSHDYGTHVIKGNGVADPSKENYEFTGWNLKSGLSAGGIDADGKFTMPDNDVVFEAVFAKKYKVAYTAYDENGDPITLTDPAYAETEYPEGGSVTVAPVLTKDGLYFYGWNVKSPDTLTIEDNSNGSRSFTMPASDVVLTGHFSAEPPKVYTITYVSGMKEGDKGFNENLGKSHEFSVTADENGNARHTVMSNTDRAINYVREGYEFAGWKISAVPQPNPAPGGNGAQETPKNYAADNLKQSGDVISVNSSVIMTAQWKVKSVITKDENKKTPEKSPGTGESAMPVTTAFNLAIISILAFAGALKRRRENQAS